MTSRQLDEEAIFHIARKLNGDDRTAYLDQICAGDMNLRQRVEALLEVHEHEQNFLKSGNEPAPTLDQPLTLSALAISRAQHPLALDAA